MQALYFDRTSRRGERSTSRRSPRTCARRRRVAARSCWTPSPLLDDDGDARPTWNRTRSRRTTFAGVLRAATLAAQLQPMLCGTSLNYIGVQPLLDARDRLPAEPDRPSRRCKGMQSEPEEGQTPRSASPIREEPFCGLIFKIVADKHADLCFVRVYSGTLKSRLADAQSADRQEGADQPVVARPGRSPRKIEIDEVEAGDIVGVDRPEGCRHRRHAVRRSISRSCWKASRSPRP